MDYAPPLVLLAVYPQNSANTPSKTSFAKPNGGVVFCASTIWARTVRPNLACCRFLKLKSLTHAREGIACSRADGGDIGACAGTSSASRANPLRSLASYTVASQPTTFAASSRDNPTPALKTTASRSSKASDRRADARLAGLFACPPEIIRKGALRRSYIAGNGSTMRGAGSLATSKFLRVVKSWTRSPVP